nr:lysophospholipid acyltransferase family protein [Acidocella aromatica]
MRTQSWRVVGDEHLQASLNSPVIAALWHETLATGPAMWQIARKRGLRRSVVVLSSMHRDGKLIGNVMRYLGMELVSGSSSRGGAEAVEALTQALADGKHVAITPDGPRGPRRVAAPGVARLAALTGAPVLPFGVWTSRAITMNTWDKMRFPLPFGRGVLAVGAPMHVTGPWEEALPCIQAAMVEIQDKAAAG